MRSCLNEDLDFRYENDKCANIETICPSVIGLFFHDDIWRDLVSANNDAIKNCEMFIQAIL